MRLTRHNRPTMQVQSSQQRPTPVLGQTQKYNRYAHSGDPLDGKELATAAAGNTTISQLPIEIDIDPVLKDIVFSEDLEQKKLVMRMFSDIYYNDSIAGSIVDIKSTLMFSDFTLGGILDRKVADEFAENVDRLNIRTLLPDVLIDYNVKGAFVGSLLYNEARKVFASIMPHPFENTKVDQLPFYGLDPILTVAMPEHLRSTMASDSPRVKELREFLGADVVKQITNEALELDPKSTVYVARRTGSTSTATSYFRRILPWYLLEKNLFRGTLVNSARRQKGILHITLDGAGEWEPTMADFQMITDLFQNADADPIGSIIATRAGVSSEEIRDPTGGWTVFDSKDNMDNYKMKSLGINESFLSGDASYSNQDASTSFFIDGVRNERDYLTRRVLYNKIFPVISATKGYTLNASGKLVVKGNMLDQLDPMGMFSRLKDGTRLLIPSMHWEKTLKPEGDQTYMDMLNALTEKGVPVPIRAMAAAGGFNLDRLLADQESDLHLVQRMEEYRKKVGEIKKQYGPATDEMATASNLTDGQLIHALNYLQNMGRTRSDVLAEGNGKILGLANRDFGEHSEVAGVTHDGKKRWLPNQKLANERANRKIVKMLREEQRKGRSHLFRNTMTPFKD